MLFPFAHEAQLLKAEYNTHSAQPNQAELPIYRTSLETVETKFYCTEHGPAQEGFFTFPSLSLL